MAGERNYIVLHRILLVYSMLFYPAEGIDLSYAVTDNIGECARKCVQTSCLLIFWKEPNLPNAGPNENCGPQPQTLDPTQIKGLNNLRDQDVKVYMNDLINNSSSRSPDCATFVYIPSGSSRSLSTPATFDSKVVCSLVLVTDGNSTLTVTASFACNSSCSCRDTLSFHNSLLVSSRSQAVVACLGAKDNTTDLIVTSAKDGFLVLEMARDVTSLASYNVTVESLPAGSLSALPSDELVKDTNSDWEGSPCYRPKDYVTSCSPGNFSGGPTSDPPVVRGENQTEVTASDNLSDHTVSSSANSTAIKTNTNIITTTGIYITDYINHASITTNNNNNNNSNNTTNTNNNNNNSNNNGKRQVSSGGTSSRLDPGIIAGVVIACLLAMMLLGVMVFFASWRHKGRRVQPGFPNGTEHVLSSSAPASTAVRAPPKGTTAI
ncbi:hypothetical protein RRG08_032104 [Elysia crispata]|uniref:Uncharacterized protein n=1 Tax=Elysia crispata TaxID=231223 RepID=A0AAE1DE75_9GAST|nr:hypothetical protein RRG08_032104 [Elysia crispata]